MMMMTIIDDDDDEENQFTWIVFASAVDAHSADAAEADHGADGVGCADPIAASIVNRRVIHP